MEQYLACVTIQSIKTSYRELLIEAMRELIFSSGKLNYPACVAQPVGPDNILASRLSADDREPNKLKALPYTGTYTAEATQKSLLSSHHGTVGTFESASILTSYRSFILWRVVAAGLACSALGRISQLECSGLHYLASDCEQYDSNTLFSMIRGQSGTQRRRRKKLSITLPTPEKVS
ncbi:hypothetical protein Cob_v007065 [Colletotrichum orbiculare MAFF 240422]|uniref:Uncharacterized protein n=1 Tax=Colletotrichum orbiculare (strain 104-T / ATCC 96160 / CBS 514.97 / LARS 414 / MAFF 240422) TaxID=1213857 RepID=A0A484FQU4_COLOR|nr:hypothetical protein Cob_v007065 [Colletotrichum orbiculare MAFF 240422]